MFIFIAVGILTFVVLYSLAAIYAERKVSAFIQDRVGPMETGKYGLLQSFADILKLLQKESIIPAAADKALFILAPAIIFISVFIGFASIPITNGVIGAGINVGVFYVIAVITIEVVGILMLGWASNNKYALMGSVRSVAQIVSYSIPAGVAVISVVMISGSLDLQVISANQGIFSSEKIFLLGFWDVSNIGGFLAWNIFQAPHLLLAFIIYFIASLAECNRAPFDLPEAESELVGGFHVEYGGIRFGIVMLAEYAMMLLVSVIAVILFLGAWNTPFPNIGTFTLANWTTGTFWGIFWLLAKAFFLIFIQMWIRWTLPRFRVDQLMAFGWKVLIPLAFLCLIISGIWKLVIMN